MAYRLNGPVVPSPTTAITGVCDIRCGLQCHTEGSHLATDYFFVYLDQHLRGHHFHVNEEVKMALGYGCKHQNPIYASTEFLISCKARLNARTNIDIMLIKDDDSEE